jgi:large subunit ribosomal protein L18
MDAISLKRRRRTRRKRGIRKRLVGTPDRPRLSVFRSLNHIYAQLVDDLSGQTLVSASSVQAKLPAGGNCDAANEVGKRIADQAKAAGIDKVAFDRNGFRFRGRVKALADAAREAGLKF